MKGFPCVLRTNHFLLCSVPQVPDQSGRDAKMIHSIASVIRAKSKLLLLESPDTVEIYKVSSSFF